VKANLGEIHEDPAEVTRLPGPPHAFAQVARFVDRGPPNIRYRSPRDGCLGAQGPAGDHQLSGPFS
jgi:hypothetical protein